MYSAQQSHGAPFHEAAAQRRAADPIPGGPQFPPLHAFAQKEPQRFDHRLGWAARTTMIAAWSFNPVNQTGHQAACRRSHRPLSCVNRTRKLGICAILSSRRNDQKLVICPRQTSETRA